jgi:hypothetical protein
VRTSVAVVASLVLPLAPMQASATPTNNGRNARYAAIVRAFGSATDATRTSETIRAKVQNHRALAHSHRALAHSHRALAHSAWTSGRNGQARREFLATARLLRSAGQLASAALCSAATLASVDENPRLADAATLGEPAVQARALLEAAVPYAHAGMPALRSTG